MPTARSLSGRSSAERTQLELFRSVPGDLAARDAQDLMAWPFFSLAKSRRTAPIDFRMGATWISVEAVPEHGMATIWDADVLIWAASQLIEARDAGRPTSRLMVTTPHEILAFTRRGLQPLVARLAGAVAAVLLQRAGRETEMDRRVGRLEIAWRCGGDRLGHDDPPDDGRPRKRGPADRR